MNNNKFVLVLLGGIMLFSAIMGFNILSSSPKNKQISLTTVPNPPSLGPTILIILVKDKKGNAVKNATVSFDLNMTTMNMGIQRGTATSQSDGSYAATGRLTMRGPWRVSIIVAMPDGNVMNKEFTINVQY